MDFCTVETASGKVRGLVSSGVRQFKGVPYGASTAGENRFQRPKSPIPWGGVRDCFGYGPVSPQVPSDMGNDYARLIQFDLNVAVGGMSEDCLHLNIWTPGTRGEEKRAVLFSIHGGGWKVSALLGMPAARGLFHRAAVQSGSLLTHLPRVGGAQVADAFIKKLGLSATTLGDIQHLPWSRLLAAQTEVGAHAFSPVLDGVNFITDPFHPQAPLESNDVPLIVSTTLDDAGLFFDNFAMTEHDLKTMLVAGHGAKAGALLALYRQLFPAKSPYLLHAQIVTDSGFRRFAHAQAERKADRLGAPVYAYLWEWASPAFEGKFGAVHAMDVTASFHNERDAIIGGGSRDALRMCDALATTWVKFAETGDPNNALIPHWPR